MLQDLLARYFSKEEMRTKKKLQRRKPYLSMPFEDDLVTEGNPRQILHVAIQFGRLRLIIRIIFLRGRGWGPRWPDYQPVIPLLCHRRRRRRRPDHGAVILVLRRYPGLIRGATRTSPSRLENLAAGAAVGPRVRVRVREGGGRVSGRGGPARGGVGAGGMGLGLGGLSEGERELSTHRLRLVHVLHFLLLPRVALFLGESRGNDGPI